MAFRNPTTRKRGGVSYFTAMWQRFLVLCERAGAWVLLLVAVVFAIDVSLRYAFGITAALFPDLEWYGVCLAVSLGLAPALGVGAHVSVEVFAERLPTALRQNIVRSGHLLLLLPWCAFVVYAGGRYAVNSFSIGEGSADPGGLPYRWLPKGFLVLAFVMLGLEGLRSAVGGLRLPFQKRAA